MAEIIYVCPIHNDVILYKETVSEQQYLKGSYGITINPDEIHPMLVPEKPKKCSKCDKSYYKSECVQKN